jgi:hypothetical protein
MSPKQTWIILAAGALLAAAVGVWAQLRLQETTLDVRPASLTPVWSQSYGRQVLAVPRRFVVAEIASFRDELFAYLMFTYLRGSPALEGTELLLSYTRDRGSILYRLQARLDGNLLTALPRLAAIRIAGLPQRYEWRTVTGPALTALRYQSNVFVTAYNLPSHRKIESLKPAELEAYVRRFVRFKSITDPRIRHDLEPAANVLDEQQAGSLAADIVAVSDFYSIPLDFFLGIGAMENNFMNIQGDLQHAVWKRRAEKDDVVLRRKKGRVLVLNQSSGVWQITRETLRYAHKLYLKDTRDYSKLPPHLRPPKELNLNEINPDLLTTYAGLLFRDLLDDFHGDVATAVGAYNGGPGRPNMKYSEGVRAAALHARSIIEQSAVLHQRPAAGMSFLSAR